MDRSSVDPCPESVSIQSYTPFSPPPSVSVALLDTSRGLKKQKPSDGRRRMVDQPRREGRSEERRGMRH